MSDPIAVMRNRVSTEFRKVAPGSEEYLELQAQRDPNDGFPVWEETSLPNAVEQSKRLDEGNPLPTDIGTAQQPVGAIRGAPPVFVPASEVNEQLPSEREAGVEPEETVLGRLPAYETGAEEQPLTAAMESATDTDVSGTEPDLEEHKSGSSGGASGAKMSRSRSKKAKSEASTSESSS